MSDILTTFYLHKTFNDINTMIMKLLLGLWLFFSWLGMLNCGSNDVLYIITGRVVVMDVSIRQACYRMQRIIYACTFEMVVLMLLVSYISMFC